MWIDSHEMPSLILKKKNWLASALILSGTFRVKIYEGAVINDQLQFS